MKVLVTGGAGYIGNTVCWALKDSGHTPIILDNLATGPREFTKDHIFYEGDIADKSLLEKIFKEHGDIFCTIHCAALIVVPESTEKPYDYYKENVSKSNELFHNLISLGCTRIVFSSSAAIYDVAPSFMVTEEASLKPSSPYARTKYMMEMILSDFANAYNLQAIALRYFNPIGADPKLRSGMHVKEPSHVVGKLVEVALGIKPEFTITGTQWPTRDGSGIRDYIHVWDLAMAHVKAVENFESAFAKTRNEKYMVINLGTGNGVTVKELVDAFEKAFGKTIPKKESGPRAGDVAGAYANANKALSYIGWKAQLSTEQGIRDALRWGEVRSKILSF